MSASSSSDQNRWQIILRNQSKANLQRWVSLIQESDDPTNLVSHDYENILRALESALVSNETFNFACLLIALLHPIVIDFADWDRWLFYLEKAKSLSQSLDATSNLKDLEIFIGDVHKNSGQLEAALAAYEQSARICKKTKDSIKFARVLAKLAVIYDLQGKSAEGIRLCQEALQQAEANEDEWGIAQANLNLSHIYIRSQQWNESIKVAKAAYDLFVKLQKPKEESKALLNLVAIYVELGRWDSIEQLSDRLTSALSKDGDLRMLSQLKNNLGILAFNQGNFKTAESFWHEALVLHSQIQEPAEVAGLYNNLGMVYTELQEWQAAENMLNHAVKAYQSLGDDFNQANALDNLAELYQAMGQTEKGLPLLQQAVSLLAASSHMPHAQQLHDELITRIQQVQT